MLIPGLVSVTFRSLSRSEIARLMYKAELPAIEWGGDVHVPSYHNAKCEEDYEQAVTEAAYLASETMYTVSYGSYYRCETSTDITKSNEGSLWLSTAESIGAPNIRVWAGNRSSDNADALYRSQVVNNIRRLADEAKYLDMTVSTEFHGGTLTDTYDSALRLIDEVARDNFYTYWQPNQFRDEEYNISALKAVLPYISNVHVFTWDAKNRYELSEGEAKWRKYIDILSSDNKPHHLLLEFVKNDSEEQFLRDAETLKKWLL